MDEYAGPLSALALALLAIGFSCWPSGLDRTAESRVRLLKRTGSGVGLTVDGYAKSLQRWLRIFAAAASVLALVSLVWLLFD